MANNPQVQSAFILGLVVRLAAGAHCPHCGAELRATDVSIDSVGGPHRPDLLWLSSRHPGDRAEDLADDRSDQPFRESGATWGVAQFDEQKRNKQIEW
ncbi:hypothetical protein I6F30_16305 [Bradyrhizobium sp. NBAIM20]|uniref:hypothetical protein n=1 Tax=unclassified Bradyrhizobium TaxID=2631580 RepID=UPI001CD4AC11|nr:MULTISPECIES: hypothetical protein [unclassified Bradyrhizobium]MCA1412684.1 hypothetical protein [Bradyrhizobium sp. NBAIM20]MCA1463466.1 hypothetical protein [Bradyrhizobium sp. NBAIM18]